MDRVVLAGFTLAEPRDKNPPYPIKQRSRIAKPGKRLRSSNSVH